MAEEDASCSGGEGRQRRRGSVEWCGWCRRAMRQRRRRAMRRRGGGARRGGGVRCGGEVEGRGGVAVRCGEGEGRGGVAACTAVGRGAAEWWRECGDGEGSGKNGRRAGADGARESGRARRGRQTHSE
jgi:hypothetical protein